MPRRLLQLALSSLVLFYASFASAGVTYRNIHVFGRSAGQPSSGLVLDAQGYAYGTTFQGGSKGGGTVYRISPTGAFEIIYVFSGHPDGKHPQGNVAFDANGNLYGTTVNGGKFTSCNQGLGCGTVFMLTPPPGGKGPWAETVLYNFAGGANDGQNPKAGVTLDTEGNLYGTTELGGYQGDPECQEEGGGCGTVFELVRSESEWTEVLLHIFTGTFGDGELSQSGLVFDAAGNLYGTTAVTAFEMSPIEGGWTLDVIHYFGAGDDGNGLAAGMVFDAAGNLYGTAEGGGQASMGVVFELSPDAGGWTETILHNFAGGKDGAQPMAGVALDAQGNIYGTTYRGGILPIGVGTVYELTPADNGQWSEAVFALRPKRGQGAGPAAPVLLVGNALYTTYSASPGGVFRLAR